MKFVIAIVFAAAGFVIADWFGLFGSRIEQNPDFIHIVYEMRDAASGAPIDEVHINCARPMQRSVCTEKLTGVPGQTEITFGVFREVEASVLFERELGFSFGRSGEMFVTFIHPNYERLTRVLTDANLGDQRRQRIRTRLKRETEE